MKKRIMEFFIHWKAYVDVCDIVVMEASFQLLASRKRKKLNQRNPLEKIEFKAIQ